MYTQFQYICDFPDPDDPLGRTYKEVNAAKAHGIPVGALVEDTETGVRAFVVSLNRDCDMTPLYCLCLDEYDTAIERDGFSNRRWDCGYPEYALKIIKLPQGKNE